MVPFRKAFLIFSLFPHGRSAGSRAPIKVKIIYTLLALLALSACKQTSAKKPVPSGPRFELVAPGEDHRIGASTAIFSGWCSLGSKVNIQYVGTFALGNPSQVDCQRCDPGNDHNECGTTANTRGKFSFPVKFSGSNGNREIYVSQLPGNSAVGQVTIRRTVNFEPLSQLAYFKQSHASNTSSNLGRGVSMDGETIVVGNYLDSTRAGAIINGSTRNSTPGNDSEGAAYIFRQSGTSSWVQEAYLKAPYPSQGAKGFGYSTAVSGDTVVIGSYGEDSNYTGVLQGSAIPKVPPKTRLPIGSNASGAAFVYKRSTSGIWTIEAMLKAPVPKYADQFGIDVAIDGDRLVVGAHLDDSLTTAGDGLAVDSGAAYVFSRSGTTWTYDARLKAVNAEASDYFGRAVGISGDTIVVASHLEDSSQTTITNGSSASSDNSAVDSGAVYVYRLSGSSWVQEAYLKAANGEAEDFYGQAVAISGDYIVVGAYGDDSNQTTITNGTTASADNSASNAGSAYVYLRSGTTWSQQAYLKTPNAGTSDQFGISLDIDDATVVVGANGEDSNQTSVTNGTTASANNGASAAGAVYVFVRSGSVWAQEAYLKTSNNEAGDQFGRNESVAVSGDYVVASSFYEDSQDTGVSSTSSVDNSRLGAGAAYVFTRTGVSWAEEAFLKAAGHDGGGGFGRSIALSDDTLVVGTYRDDGGETSITHGTTYIPASLVENMGAVYVFRDTAGTWAQEAVLKPVNGDPSDSFGVSVDISGDTIVVGAYQEDSTQTTITNGATASAANGASGAGAVYVYTRSGVTWSQEAYIKAPNAEASDQFGFKVDIDGDTLAVGANGEDSSQTTITNGATASADNSALSSGAVYIFTRSGVTWSQEAYIKTPNSEAGDTVGAQLALRGDRLVVGVPGEDSNQSGIFTSVADNDLAENSGAIYVFDRTGTSWAFSAYLKSPFVETQMRYGSTLALYGDYLAAGVNFESDRKYQDGLAYIYKHNGTAWVLQQKLTSNAPSSSMYFGTCIAMDDGKLVLTAVGESGTSNGIFDGTNQQAETTSGIYGAAYSYLLDSGGTWAVANYFRGSALLSGESFGASCAISGDKMAVGATSDSNSTTGVQNGSVVTRGSSAVVNGGSVYLFGY